MHAGVDAEAAEPGVWRVAPGPVAGGVHVVEPDLSNAAPFLAAAMVTGGTVRVPGWPAATTQPGDVLRDLLTAHGRRRRARRRTASPLRGTGHIAPLDADLRDVSELTTVIAALAALADGAVATCPGSGTCAGTRPTGSPRCTPS